MGGDENIAEWLGDMCGDEVTTVASTPQRFSATSKRFRDVYIHDRSTTISAYYGKYEVLAADFGPNAFIIYPQNLLHFSFIDLYELGHMALASPTELRVIGINEY